MDAPEQFDAVDEFARAVLVIDDVRTFDFDAVYARDAESAIALLVDGWDEVWFDFDLGCGRSTRRVVDWVVEQIRAGYRPRLGEVVVHSSNHAGAEWIVAQLSPHFPTRLVDQETVYAHRRTV